MDRKHYGYLIVTPNSIKHADTIAKIWQKSNQEIKKVISSHGGNPRVYNCSVIFKDGSFWQRYKFSRATGIPLKYITKVSYYAEINSLMAADSLVGLRFFGNILVFAPKEEFFSDMLDCYTSVEYYQD